MQAKYLSISIHDNDFMNYAESLMESINFMFKFFHFYPKDEQDLERLKSGIAHMWTSYDLIDKACQGTFGENRLDMFMKNLDLKIVDFTDIPDWDNYETMYIPLFENAENIIK